MLERPGYTSTDPNQLRVTWEMACNAEAELFPERAPGGLSDGFMQHLVSVLDRRFGTVRSRTLQHHYEQEMVEGRVQHV